MVQAMEISVNLSLSLSLSRCFPFLLFFSIRPSLVPSPRSHQMYYMFGFLFLVFIILVITCSEATILLCYFHLCAEVGHAHAHTRPLCQLAVREPSVAPV